MTHLSIVILTGLQLCAPAGARLQAWAKSLERALPASSSLELSAPVSDEVETCAALTLKALPDASSVNLDRLRRLTTRSAVPGIRGHLLDPGKPFPSLLSTRSEKGVVLKPCPDYFGFSCTVGVGDNALAQGITLFPTSLPLRDQTFYSTTGQIEFYVSAQEPELESFKTFFHELVHAEAFRKTGLIELSGHKGPEEDRFNRDCAQAENEAELLWRP